ncbi:MAG: amidohydrolase [Arenimonas sp.]
MEENLNISLIQGNTRWHDPQANRDYYGELLKRETHKTDIFILPETFTSGFSNDAIADAETMQGPTLTWMLEKACDHNAVLTGSVQIREGSQVFNRLIWARPDGHFQYYDKRHLFRMANEHQRYASGDKRLTIEYKGWRICPLVCYDLRFPVYSRNCFSRETENRFDYDLLLYVANWPAARRHAWNNLLPARAIENLAYVAGVNRVGADGNSIDYAGDSVALDYMGQAIVAGTSQDEVLCCRLSANDLQAYRDRFPAYLDADKFELFS